MADINKIKVDNVEYDVKDTVARSGITSLTTQINNNYREHDAINDSNVIDANTIKESGIYRVSLDGLASTTYNFPTAYGVIIVNNSNPYVSQIYHDVVNNNLHVRTSDNNGSTWGTWKTISAT